MLNEVDLKTLNKGDKVYVVSYTANGYIRFTEMIVSNITPSGMLDLKFDLSGSYITRLRFGADGRERGGPKYCRRHIDTDMTFRARAAYISKMERAQNAANTLNELTSKHGDITKWWGRDAMNEVLDKLQAEINAARALVNAI